MRLLVCGGRNFADRSHLFDTLDALHQARAVSALVHGMARGADTMAGEWADARGIPVLAFPALWDLHGRAAGPIRNAQMLEEASPSLVVAFPGGGGTRDMVARALAAGVETIVVPKKRRPRRARVDDGTGPIERFLGRHFFLSNFYPLPAPMIWRGMPWRTSEHAYQAAKFWGDDALVGQIADLPKAGQAKRLARDLRDRIAKGFGDVKLTLMHEIVACKFADPELCRMLLATADRELVEGNVWNDTFWGVSNGAGENHLGRILMQVRAAARRSGSTE